MRFPITCRAVPSLVVATALLASAAASAAPTFHDFSFVETGFEDTSVGSFSGRFEVDGGLIIGITGSGATLGTITSLFGPGTVSVNPAYPPNDNVFTDLSPWLSFDGVSFASTGFAAVNMFWNNGNWRAIIGQGTTRSAGSDGQLSVTQVQASVPEPTALALVGLALAALAATRRRAS